MWQGLPFHQLKQMDSLLSVLSLSLPLPLPLPFLAPGPGPELRELSPTPPFCKARTFLLPPGPIAAARRPASLSSASRAFFRSFLALALAALSEGGALSVAVLLSAG